jgi:hypothetical protein
MFDRNFRLDIVKALILPVINLYDFIYASASPSNLRRLDVAYNDLMRAVLGMRRSIHCRIEELHKLTTLQKLADLDGSHF